MLVVKKAFAYLWRYVLGIFLAVLVTGIVGLIYKRALITVQGPTLFSRVSMTVVFYLALSAAIFLLFRRYAIKQTLGGLKGIYLFAGAMIIIHVVIVVFASWTMIWRVSGDTVTLAKLLYTGGDLPRSLTEIPRVYYLIALVLEDICFIIFSQIGYRSGSRKKASLQSKNNSDER